MRLAAHTPFDGRRSIAGAWVSAIVLFAVALGGCERVKERLGDRLSDRVPKRIATVDIAEAVVADEPWHVLAAINAVVKRLRGASAEDIVATFKVDRSEIIVAEKLFRYEDFALAQVKLLVNRPIEQIEGGHALTGYLHFEEATGRRAAAVFEVDYAVRRGLVTLVRGHWAPLFAAFPETEMYIVPTQALTRASDEAMMEFIPFYTHVIEHAVPLRAPERVGRKRDHYTIVVILKDRIAPDAKFQVRLSSRRHTPVGDAQGVTYVGYDTGWLVGAVGGTFAVDTRRPFWVKAVLEPGHDVPREARGERVVGLFSTAPVAAN